MSKKNVLGFKRDKLFIGRRKPLRTSWVSVWFSVFNFPLKIIPIPFRLHSDQEHCDVALPIRYLQESSCRSLDELTLWNVLTKPPSSISFLNQWSGFSETNIYIPNGLATSGHPTISLFIMIWSGYEKS